MFDEEPDGDPHGECTAEIHALQALLRQALEALTQTYQGDQTLDERTEVIAAIRKHLEGKP